MIGDVPYPRTTRRERVWQNIFTWWWGRWAYVHPEHSRWDEIEMEGWYWRPVLGRLYRAYVTRRPFRRWVVGVRAK